MNELPLFRVTCGIMFFMIIYESLLFCLLGEQCSSTVRLRDEFIVKVSVLQNAPYYKIFTYIFNNITRKDKKFGPPCISYSCSLIKYIKINVFTNFNFHKLETLNISSIPIIYMLFICAKNMYCLFLMYYLNDDGLIKMHSVIIFARILL